MSLFDATNASKKFDGPRHKVTFQLRTLQDDGTSEVTFTIEADELPEWDVHEFGQRAKRMHFSFLQGWASEAMEPGP